MTGSFIAACLVAIHYLEVWSHSFWTEYNRCIFLFVLEYGVQWNTEDFYCYRSV